MIIMKKNNKKLTAAIGLALGVTIFTGAALASYNTSSGYDIGKKAAKGLLENANYTLDASLKLSIDGNAFSGVEAHELYDRDGEVKLNRSEKSIGDEIYSSNTDFSYYRQGSDYISTFTHDGEERTTVYHNADDYMGRGALDSMSTARNDKDRDTVNKIVRFVELAADTFVGDLKNNIVYVSGDDNGATYEMNLDTIQVPELVNAGISAMFSAMSQNEYNENDPFLTLGTDPVVKNVSLKFSVDSEGRLTDMSANTTLAGDGHEAAVDVAMRIYDYGTTKPVSVDISTLPNVQEIDCNDNSSSSPSYSVSVDEEAEENGHHVDEDGNVLDSEGNVVGTVEINGDGEGVIVYNN